MPFRDRRDAGQRLAEQLRHLRAEQPLVLALPRGGVVVAEQVAVALGAPLAALIACRLSAPDYSDLAIAALAEGGVRLIEELPVRLLGLPRGTSAQVWAVGEIV